MYVCNPLVRCYLALSFFSALQPLHWLNDVLLVHWLGVALLAPRWLLCNCANLDRWGRQVVARVQVKKVRSMAAGKMVRVQRLAIIVGVL
jgi:hypothetical protein